MIGLKPRDMPEVGGKSKDYHDRVIKRAEMSRKTRRTVPEKHGGKFLSKKLLTRFHISVIIYFHFIH